MSLLQYDEYSKIINKMNNDMPWFLDGHIKIPYKYAPFPKDIMQVANDVNQKFLNKWQSKLEDIMSPIELQSFVDYQNSVFTNSNERLFKRFISNTKKRIDDIIIQSTHKHLHSLLKYDKIYESAMLSLSNIGFIGTVGSNQCDPGVTISVASNSLNATGWASLIIGDITSVVIDKCYNQHQSNFLTTVALGTRGALYDAASTLPTNLLAESASETATIGATWFNYTSDAITGTTAAAIMIQIESNTTRTYYGNDIRPFKSVGYGPFTENGFTSNNASVPLQRSGHV